MTAVDVDALDAALAKAQPPVSVFAGLTQDHEYPTDVNALYRDGGSAAFAECYGEESAALIVAAVNALPELLAEVRRGRALREAVLRFVLASDDGTEYEHQHPVGEGEPECPACWADGLRAVIAATNGTT